MDLKTYISEPDRRADLVAKMGCSNGYLWQVATGWKGRKASIEFAKDVERHTEGAVSRRDMRPDLYEDVDAAANGRAA